MDKLYVDKNIAGLDGTTGPLLCRSSLQGNSHYLLQISELSLHIHKACNASTKGLHLTVFYALWHAMFHVKLFVVLCFSFRIVKSWTSTTEWDLNSGSSDPKPTTLTMKPTSGIIKGSHTWCHWSRGLAAILDLPEYPLKSSPERLDKSMGNFTQVFPKLMVVQVC